MQKSLKQQFVSYSCKVHFHISVSIFHATYTRSFNSKLKKKKISSLHLCNMFRPTELLLCALKLFCWNWCTSCAVETCNNELCLHLYMEHNEATYHQCTWKCTFYMAGSILYMVDMSPCADVYSSIHTMFHHWVIYKCYMLCAVCFCRFCICGIFPNVFILSFFAVFMTFIVLVLIPYVGPIFNMWFGYHKLPLLFLTACICSLSLV